MKNQLEAALKTDYQLSLAYSEKRQPFTSTSVVPISSKTPSAIPSTGNENLFKVHPIVKESHNWDVNWFAHYE